MDHSVEDFAKIRKCILSKFTDISLLKHSSSLDRKNLFSVYQFGQWMPLIFKLFNFRMPK